MTRVTVNPMAMFSSPFAEEYPALVASGADGVGLALRKLDSLGWELGVSGARDAGLTVDYLVLGLMTPPGEVAAWSADHDLLARGIDTAAELGARTIYFCSGPPGPVRFEAAAAALGERLAPLAVRARAAGVQLALENTLSSRGDISFVFSLADALVVARAADITICADTYCCWVEPDVAGTLSAAAGEGRLGLVQVSDRSLSSLTQPDRRVPGDGDLPLARLLDDVLGSGYQGPIDLELLGPVIESEGPASAVARGVAWLRTALAAP